MPWVRAMQIEAPLLQFTHHTSARALAHFASKCDDQARDTRETHVDACRDGENRIERPALLGRQVGKIA